MDDFKLVLTLFGQQGIMLLFYRGQQGIELGDTGVVEVSAWRQQGDEPDTIKGFIGFLVIFNIVEVHLELLFIANGFVKELHLGLKEAFYILELVLYIIEVVFFFDDPLNQGDIVFLLGEDIFYQVDSVGYQGFIRIGMANVPAYSSS